MGREDLLKDDLYDDFAFEGREAELDDYTGHGNTYDDGTAAEDMDDGLYDEDGAIDDYDSREDAYQDYVSTTDNEALKVMTNEVELFLKHNCANHQNFSDAELIQIAADLHSADPITVAKAKEKLSMAVFKYVRHIAAQRYKMYYQYIPDLIQEGLCAVLTHAHKYNPAKGTLTTFFKPHILAQMRTWVSENKYNLQNANHYGNHIRQIERKISEKAKKGETTVIDDLYISGGMAQTTVERCLAIKTKSEQSVSMDDENAFIGGTAESSYPSPDKIIISKEKNEALATIFNKLDSTTKDILIRYLGLIDGEARPISEIAASLDTTPQHVRDIIRKGLLQLKEHMEKAKIFNTDRCERRKSYTAKSIDFHKKSKDLQKILDGIDLEDFDEEPDFIQ